MSTMQEAIKAAKEKNAAAGDPNAKAEAPQILSSAGTDEGAKIQGALEASQAGASSAAKVMDPVAGIRATPPADVVVPQVAAASFIPAVPAATVAANKDFRVFRHAFAGATTIMPNGKVLQFGGGAGGSGYYATDKPEEIAFLVELVKSSGSQVSEPEEDLSGSKFRRDQELARDSARENTAHFASPSALKAFESLETTVRNA